MTNSIIQEEKTMTDSIYNFQYRVEEKAAELGVSLETPGPDGFRGLVLH